VKHAVNVGFISLERFAHVVGGTMMIQPVVRILQQLLLYFTYDPRLKLIRRLPCHPVQIRWSNTELQTVGHDALGQHLRSDLIDPIKGSW